MPLRFVGARSSHPLRDDHELKLQPGADLNVAWVGHGTIPQAEFRAGQIVGVSHRTLLPASRKDMLIPDVEKLGPQLETHFFANADSLMQREIGVGEAKHSDIADPRAGARVEIEGFYRFESLHIEERSTVARVEAILTG